MEYERTTSPPEVIDITMADNVPARNSSTNTSGEIDLTEDFPEVYEHLKS